VVLQFDAKRGEEVMTRLNIMEAYALMASCPILSSCV